MEKSFKKSSGYSLILGSVLLVITMVLHPVGGDLEHIRKIKFIIILSHSLAILSLPFIGFGFYGLAELLKGSNRLSILGLLISSFGLIAAMLAATINGLNLSLFASYVVDNSSNPDLAYLIVRYGSFFNISNDYILITSLTLAILLWSFLIIQNIEQRKWIGYLGYLIGLVLLVSAIYGNDMVSLFGFRLVVFSIVSWLFSAAIFLLLSKTENP